MSGNVLSAKNTVVRSPIYRSDTLIADIPNDKNMIEINPDSEKYNQEHTEGC